MGLKVIPVKSYVALFLILSIGPLIILVLMTLKGMQLGVIFYLLLSVPVLTGLILLHFLKRRFFEVTNELIRIRSTFYLFEVGIGAGISFEKLESGNFKNHVGFRMNGLGLPGFSSGWFRRRGGGKVFVDYVGGDFVMIESSDGPIAAISLDEDAIDKLRLSLAKE